MKKTFKSKRKKKGNFLFGFTCFGISLFSSYLLLSKGTNTYFIEGDVSKLLPIKLDKEKILLKMSLNYKAANKTNNSEIKTEAPVFNEIKYTEPSIYIYNTHQTEEYTNGTIFDAATKLKEYLEEQNVHVVLESTNISDALKEKNYTYKDSYKITRDLLLKNFNDDIALCIDLHRDSASKEVTTTEIDGLTYAKAMFVVGGKHETYLENYQVADDLNKLLKNRNNTLTRGIFVRKSSSYNQDLASNIVLIELGGPNNTMEEVNNTLKIVAETIAYYISE